MAMESRLGLHRIVRRKQSSTEHQEEHQRHNGAQLSKELRVPQLLAIGIGTTIGAGIFILIGTVAKERTGPALTISFLVAGTAAALSGLCYAELASRLPSAGSAYHYAYTCLGEGLAWFVGWSLILEYTVSSATVARGVTPNLALFFGEDLPFWIRRWQIPGTELTADPFAGALIIVVTILLCTGIKESAAVQVIMTTILVTVLLFVVFMGLWIGFRDGWLGYELKDGYLPFGVSGVLSGAATLFFSYVGFDAVATTAEEVKNPQVDLPIGIGLALFICASLYMSVSAVIVGIVPYNLLNTDTPIATAFSQSGAHWAMYIVAVGALTAMLTTLLGCSLPQPRILLAMSRDGLLPSFFSIINKVTSVPVNGALTTGTIATAVAVLMDVQQLSEMVSVGTLLAFTAVALCVLTIRYSPPPYTIHLPVLTQSVEHYDIPESKIPEDISGIKEDDDEHSEDACTVDLNDRLLEEETITSVDSGKKSWLAVGGICLVVLGSFLFSIFLSVAIFVGWLQVLGATFGGLIFIGGLAVVLFTKQDESHLTFGNPGGFKCPLVPILPVVSILINIYLLVNVGAATWARVSIWLLVGAVIYVFYGIRHSIH